jgi:peptidoglycan hydrolase CwlO-like protein
MKSKLVILMMMVGLFSVMPVFAASDDITRADNEGIRQCALQAESIQEKMARLQGEIKKGTDKYSEKEIKRLEKQLKDANETLEQLLKR